MKMELRMNASAPIDMPRSFSFFSPAVQLILSYLSYSFSSALSIDWCPVLRTFHFVIS